MSRAGHARGDARPPRAGRPPASRRPVARGTVPGGVADAALPRLLPRRARGPGARRHRRRRRRPALHVRHAGGRVGAAGRDHQLPEHRRREPAARDRRHRGPPAWQRSPVNTEAKYLQLRHCFETLGCLRVEFKTDARNAASRAALARIGAVEEGTFRRHVVLPDGFVRDRVSFSVVDQDWPHVRAPLEARLASYPGFVAPTGW